MTECKAAISQEKTIKTRIKSVYNFIKRKLYLYIWLSYFYRPIMRLMHKFNLHYTTVIDIYEIDEQELFGQHYVTKHLWCQWCGLRGKVHENKIRCD